MEIFGAKDGLTLQESSPKTLLALVREANGTIRIRTGSVPDLSVSNHLYE